MDGGRRGERGLLGGAGRGGEKRCIGRHGFWVSLRGRNQGAMVEEGVDFAQDSVVGGGDDFLFVSDSEEEVSNDFNDRSFAPHSKQPGAVCAPFTAPPYSDGLEAVAWHDIAGHSQPPEEEAYVEHPDLQGQDAGADDEFRERGEKI
ncbi:hypothetical protein SETIT_3G339300v2 [Setaria italica]|uniref:Uncharacterized protein n=1 Tax=Setaria italica TaxID=4555 RepID=A0A368QLN4_SETIT|nr:hypothetical protein SETIT_3G339300v2 [Setaria italica]